MVTGQGLAAQRVKIGSTINTVRAEDLEESREHNVIHALAGKAPNVEVTSSSGDPGGGAYIRIRGTRSVEGGTQPLIVVDGTPITNASHAMYASGLWGTAYQNRAADLNPDDIESIEILKGAAAASVYGSRASNGVVLITTKSGRRNSTQVTVKASASFDRATRLPRLQTRFGQGLVDLTDLTTNLAPASLVSWGPELPPGTQTFDHAGELFGAGFRTDNTVMLSGGSDRTTYYLSLGYLYHDGTIEGNSSYRRFTTRLKGSHDFGDKLIVGANFAYTTSTGDLIQHGSDRSALLLPGLRTPPEFNNCRPEFDPCYRNEVGLPFSYWNPNPTTLEESRGFDNPFWVANELPTSTEVKRLLANITVDYAPTSWLNLRYLLGSDYANDERLEILAPGSSSWPLGALNRQDLVDEVFDQSLLATLEHAVSNRVTGSLTVGLNLNQTKFRRLEVGASDMIEGTQKLEFTAEQYPLEFESSVRTQGYFAEATLDLLDQVFLKGGVRYDGANTFGGDTTVTGEPEPHRFWYPTASAVWQFGQHVGFLDFAKVRVAYGKAGVQPPPFSNVHGFETHWAGSYRGLETVQSEATLGNTRIQPEETREWEVGADLAVLGNRLSLGVTRYWQETRNAILRVPLASSTGFEEMFANGASWRNWGWEVTLDVMPLQTASLSWQLSGQWATNHSNVDTLLGAESIYLNGFTGGATSSRVVQGYPLPILFGTDFIRFGNGSTVNGVSIDAAYPEVAPGTLYVCGGPPECPLAGFPLRDPRQRVIGDPNPDWTGSIRSSLTFFGKVRLSGLLDIKRGGDMSNGTKGSLFYYGTHKETEPMHGAGIDTVFAGAGPGAGTPVTLNWDTWAVGGLGSGFRGPGGQFVEDAGFVKLRDVSLSFTLDSSWLGKIGFTTLTMTVSGRNLVTWTDYSGLDPESNLTGQSAGRGLEYYNHPQTRSTVLTLTLRR